MAGAGAPVGIWGGTDSGVGVGALDRSTSDNTPSLMNDGTLLGFMFWDG